MKRTIVFSLVSAFVLLLPTSLIPATEMLPPKTFQIARKALVRVEIYFKKAERPEEVELEGDRFDARGVMRFIEEKKSMNLTGVVLRNRSEVIIPEVRLDENLLDRIEVIAWDGERKRARIRAILIHSPAMLLELEGGGLKNVAAPSFVPPPSPEKEMMRVVALYYAKPRWELQSSIWTAQSALYENPDASVFQYSPYAYPTTRENIRLVFDSRGNPVGLDITSAFEPGEDTGLWKGESFINAEIIPYDEYKKFRKDWANAYNGVIHEVKVEFRKKSRGDSSSGGFFGRLLSAAEDDADDSLKEMKAYGPAVGEKLLFVPQSISQPRAKLIDEITVIVDGQDRKAKFVGAFKDFKGFLVELEEGEFPRSADLDQADHIERVKTFYVLRAREKFGGKHMQIQFNRWLEKDRGYKNEYYWSPLHPIQEGDFILDSRGRLAGIWLGIRKEGEEIRRAASAQSYSFWGREYSDMDWRRSGGNNIFFSAAGLEEIFSSPGDHFDPTIQPRTKKEERRRCWLGVEFDGLTKDLAKSLEVEKPTLDGSIGLLVSGVYEDSPAARLGIKPGDILIRLKPEKGIESLDLKLSREEFNFDFDEGDVPPQFKALGFKMPVKPPWRSRGNYLNKILETIGEGGRVTLTYISGKEEKFISFEIERAPVDYDSAPRYKDKEIGLTVKDITYEVRTALDMKPDDPGVVIANVEEGSPGALARLEQYEIIVQLDGQPLKSVDEFEKAIEEARKQEKNTVQIQVMHLGEARFADLQLNQANSGAED